MHYAIADPLIHLPDGYRWVEGVKNDHIEAYFRSLEGARIASLCA